MELGTLLLIALLLVCPLTMFWLMRYGHRSLTPEDRASGSEESRNTPRPGPGG